MDYSLIVRSENMPYVSVEVDVDLEDLDTDEMIEELQNRGYFVSKNYNEILQEIYLLHQQGKDHQEQLRQLFWNVLGRI
jgi:hypothetical protein